MRIAINAADLDHSRIDGTRIYIQNLLKNFGRLDKDDRFLIYHKNKFNPQLEFPVFENYEIIEKPFPLWWTQTRFSWEIFKGKPDVLWMPMHSLPFLRPKGTKTVVTIHDLAFKFFPDHFKSRDLRRLNFFTDHAIKNSDRIIAISNSTKKDILETYPGIREEKIKVIYHGYDKELYNEDITQDEIKRVSAKYQMPSTEYIIFVGAIQPRKNILTLLRAFSLIRLKEEFKNLGLVIAGGAGWLAENIIEEIKKTPGTFMTGKFETRDLPALIKGAKAYVLPSLYEGFGLPVLEAMACGTPVIVSNNSSLPEVAGSAAVTFDACSKKDLAEALLKILQDDALAKDLKKKGLDHVKKYSWEKCAKETLEILTKW